MVYHDAAIRAVIERLGLQPLKSLAQQPGVQTVYRIIAYYADGRAHHSVSTLWDKHGSPTLQMESIHAGFFKNKALIRQIDRDDYLKFRAVLNQTKFDTLYFPSEDLLHVSTIWCIERATGSFYHQLVLTPHTTKKPYIQIVNAIDGYLHDAIREIGY